MDSTITTSATTAASIAGTTKTIIDPAPSQNFSDIIKSSWLLKRLLDSFADAIVEQSNESGLPGNRSKSMIAYCISPFAVFCMLTATILNRIVIFASSRNNKKLPVISKVILRLIAIYLLLDGSYGLISSLKLYSRSSIFQTIIPRYFDFDKDSFYKLTFLNMSYSDKYYELISTSATGVKKTFYGPTPTILRPFYLSLCLSQIIETFIAVTNGNDPYIENGLTLFEYSLAFQEVQTAMRPSIELLFIGIIALINQLNIHILGLFDAQKYRLIPSFILGIFTLTFYVKIFVTGRLFYIPFTVMMGYLPQLITLAIILSSILIYALAALFKFSISDLTFSTLTDHRESLNVKLSDDFYTALIRIGSFVINAAAKQSYVKEFSNIALPITTYIDEVEQAILTRKKSSAYGNEISNNPEMIEYQKSKSKRRERSWILKHRLVEVTKLIKKFGVLLGSIIFRRRRSIQSDEFSNRIQSIHPSRDYDSHMTPQLTMEDLVDISMVDDEDLETSYGELILNSKISEIDDSEDYNPELEPSSSDNEYEYNSDYDSDMESITAGAGTTSSNIYSDSASLRKQQYEPSTSKPSRLSHKESALTELITPSDFQALVMPKTAEEVRYGRILNFHMQSNRDQTGDITEQEEKEIGEGESHALEVNDGPNSSVMVTRSKFNNYYNSDLRLSDFIRSKRLKNKVHFKRSSDNSDDENEEFAHLGNCVICHVNSRYVILWPCKCLAICESCRVSLFVRSFNECVCCRSKVEGYSKVYIP
ncbi:hypothetical protein CANARDRAFT_213005 [[Candida] arabinofermentans NRRL YB-2248]|uniref:RING-type domain-containing protein n=1 Tax=[Candida] arabinofermentans NRRL YB-2248 TaxID=983967 RepID=A0A1E4SZN3_9ASCO|nr:hypothetical protein CANARDRAFT_213005 [[Candida] arabinofermentans NRRL YB-2248]